MSRFPVTLLRQEALWLATGRNGVLGFAGFRKDAPRLAAGSFTVGDLSPVAESDIRFAGIDIPFIPHIV